MLHFRFSDFTEVGLKSNHMKNGEGTTEADGVKSRMCNYSKLVQVQPPIFWIYSY